MPKVTAIKMCRTPPPSNFLIWMSRCGASLPWHNKGKHNVPEKKKRDKHGRLEQHY
jgi:hypothetical protein